MFFHTISWLSIFLLVHHGFSQSFGFDAREATVDSVHHSLFSGLSTCREVVSAFLTRIETFNHNINAIISLNPDALAVADTMDAALSSGNATGSLFCVPILLKDNYDTVEMNTTGGCLALAGSRPTADAPVVSAFKRAGAIILGKTNLQELALEGLSVSSVGGQTINPYDFTRTPGGSSGGSGVAVAASFSVFATGTDTVNSLRSPASANSLFSIRPTRGLISRAGIIPLSYTQDALGVIARTIKDVAIGLAVMAGVGFDSADNTTALSPRGSADKDYTTSLGSSTLSGIRLGLLEPFFNRTNSSETTPVNDAMGAVVQQLRRAGAVVVPIDEAIYNATSLAAKLDTQRFEYRQEMNQYLSTSNLSGVYPRTLNELYATNTSGKGGEFLVVPSQYDFVESALVSSTSNATYDAVLAGLQNLTLALQATFTRNSLDAIIYPEQKNLVVKIGSTSQTGRNGILAALTGSPVLTVPIGFSLPSAEAPIGVPIGMEVLGQPWQEEKLLQLGYEMEKLFRARRAPSWAPQYLEAKEYENVPVVRPNSSNVPAEYPVGVLE
ncbi:amidase signature enzyme [Saccharata proteae CBS 121410]|uniref:Amidase signature enzyme n=1 Tax=Saccharata proteae CBS 121410 TaxID=1314787 RepID=A0A9P4HSN0_9PEZI|nr:amidase signature enzyme [Saccharata proteae CBS 121410]